MFGKACSKGFLSILRMSARLTVAIYFAVGVLALATAAQAGQSSLRELPEVLQGAVSGALGLDDAAYHVEQASESCRGWDPAQRFEATWSDGMAFNIGP